MTEKDAIEWLEKDVDRGDPHGSENPICPMSGTDSCPSDSKSQRKCPSC